MEHSPSKPEDGAAKKVARKKKKRAEALGVFAMDPKTSTHEVPEDADSIWGKLTLTRRHAGATKEVVPLSHMANQEATNPKPEVGEIEVPLDTLSQPERQFVEQEIIASQPESGNNQAIEGREIDSNEAAAINAVERFRHKIITDGRSTEQAFAETLQELERPLGSTDDPEAEPDLKTTIRTAETGSLTPAHGESPDYPVMSVTDRGDAATGHSGETDKQTSHPAHTGGISPPGKHSARLGGDYFPPPPPSRIANPTPEKEYVPYYNDGDVMGAALIGGIVGYLIGRRRGRIKTERKLRPIQKKLEKQVKGLQENIATKEYHIRKIARERAREQQHMSKIETTGTNDPKRTEALEANQLHGKEVASERIGRVLVTAGKKSSREGSGKQSKESPGRPSPTDRRIETMSRAELLDLSENATVENTTLRQVYETHLVSEQGLRRLVSEYARGGDVQKALREELVEREIDYERDPILRDRDRPTEHSTNAKDALGELLRKADVLSETQTRDELAVLKARQAHHESQRQHQQKSRRVADIAMVTAIAVLFVLVVMLLVRGR